jgi:PHS family inorganic phosphate transporter-like MFS transporter
MMGAVFAMQGLGQLAAAFVMLFVTIGFKQSLINSTSPATCTGGCAEAVDKMWRIVIGFGAVPGCIALYYRLTIPETPRYTFDVARDVERADDDIKAYIGGRHEGTPDELTRITAQRQAVEHLTVQKASWSDFIRHYSTPKNGMLLAGYVVGHYGPKPNLGVITN